MITSRISIDSLGAYLDDSLPVIPMLNSKSAASQRLNGSRQAFRNGLSAVRESLVRSTYDGNRAGIDAALRELGDQNAARTTWDTLGITRELV